MKKRDCYLDQERCEYLPRSTNRAASYSVGCERWLVVMHTAKDTHLPLTDILLPLFLSQEQSVDKLSLSVCGWFVLRSIRTVLALSCFAEDIISEPGTFSLLGYWVIHIRADPRLAPSQWETSLQSNAVSHWLGAYLESALHILKVRLKIMNIAGA